MIGHIYMFSHFCNHTHSLLSLHEVSDYNNTIDLYLSLLTIYILGLKFLLFKWQFHFSLVTNYFCSINLEENFQDETLNVPEPVDNLLSDYAKRFNEIKTPRKLLWKKNLGTVKVWFKIKKKKKAIWYTDIWITPMFKQSKICPVFLYICPESVNHSLFYLSWMCSWSCNLKIGQCSSQWHLYMQQLLCNFRIKRGNHGNYLNALYAIHQ